MLILAGVSLNAIIGDNGIITNAQQASMKSGIAALEEWLQEKYVEFYEDSDNYINKQEVLAANLSNLFLKDGSKNYVTYEGNMYYLINKSALPKEISDGLMGGDTNEYYKYIRLIDVYGVTSDLKIYYLSNAFDETIYGNVEELKLNPNDPSAKINNDAQFSSVIKDTLASLGIDSDGNVTVGQASQIKELTIDGSKVSGITNIKVVSELRNLRKLVIKNVNITSLEGIESCIYLEYILISNTTCNDYSSLKNMISLNYLYLHNSSNQDVEKLSNGLKDSILSKLYYFGIYGRGDGYEDPATEAKTYYSYVSGLSNVTDISSLSKISKITREAINYLYLGNNQLNSVSSVSYFPNVKSLVLTTNSALTNLNGVGTLSNLLVLHANNCSLLNDISDIATCTKLQTIWVHQCPKLQKLVKVSGDNQKNYLAFNCDIKDISEFSNFAYLRTLNLQNNANLEHVNYLKSGHDLVGLYLAGCNKMIADEVKELDETIKKCGTNYSLPDKYLLYLSNVTKIIYNDNSLVDSSDEICALKGKSSIKDLCLSGTGIGKSKIAYMLRENKLNKTDLDGILNNLTQLTDTQKTYINSLKAMTDAQIAALTDAQINSMESDSDIFIRYLVSTMPEIYRLNLRLPNLTKIDFVNKLNSLRGLDLTDAGVTDLSILETKVTSTNGWHLGTLKINNTNIDLTKIQTVLSRIDRSGGWGWNSYGGEVPWHIGSGLLLGNLSLGKSLENCTEITSLRIIGSDGWVTTGNFGGSLDLSKCKKLSYFYSYALTTGITWPDSLRDIQRDWSSGVDNFSNCSYISAIQYNHASTYSVIRSSLISMKGDINYLEIGCASDDFSTLTNDFNPKSITTWYITGNNKNVSGLGKYTSLVNLYVVNNQYVTNLDFAKTLTNLVYLYAYNNKITDISGVSGLTTKLNYLHLENNSVNNIESLSNLTNLTYLYLPKNQIENTINVTDENGNINVIDNIEILKKLRESGKLRYLSISTNPITDDSKLKAFSWSSYSGV